MTIKKVVKKLYPPFGYKFNDGKGVNIDDEKGILEVCLSLSDDPAFVKAVEDSTHKERLANLKENGFEIVKE